MIYIASPYSSPIIGVAQSRFEKVRRFTAHLFSQGHNAFSPIVYAHEMAGALILLTDAATWINFNSDMLRHSEACFVYCIQGWDTSKGVKVEMQQAKAVMIPLVFINEDFTVRAEA